MTPENSNQESPQRPEPSPSPQERSEQSAIAGAALGFMMLFFVVVGGLTFNAMVQMEIPEREVPRGKVIERRMQVLNGKDVETGLKVGPGWELVKSSCLSCHSSKLIVQNRMSRDAWEKTIRWMQETQGLGPLYDNEPIILDYLAAYYAPQNMGRRKNLENIDWYVLE